MGKIIVSENITLDGVIQDPTGEEGLEHGGWFGQATERDRAEWAKLQLDEALATEALLLGRRTDEWFAARWLSRTGEWADRLNSMPKYVVSGTVTEPRWSTAAGPKGTVLGGDVAGAVARLKQQIAGDIVVYASIRLVHTLLEHDLVDELRLTVYPVLAGTGEHLFGETGGGKSLRLIGTQPVGDTLVLLSYERVRDA
jgi:dihydrofolate reductase